MAHISFVCHLSTHRVMTTIVLRELMFFFVSVCNFVVHDRCMKTVVSPCSSIATSLIKVCILHFQSVGLFNQSINQSISESVGPYLWHCFRLIRADGSSVMFLLCITYETCIIEPGTCAAVFHCSFFFFFFVALEPRHQCTMSVAGSNHYANIPNVRGRFKPLC